MNKHTPDEEKRYTILRYLFTIRKKHSACPICLACRYRYDKIKAHCEAEFEDGSKLHGQIIDPAFATFEKGYREAIDYDPKDNLCLPSARSACFDLDTVIDFKSSKIGGNPEIKFDLLLEAAEKSAMKYICPLDFHTFNSMKLLRRHWSKGTSQDIEHGRFASQSITVFVQSFTRAMGREFAKLPLGLDKRGIHSPHECFEISFVMREMGLKSMVELYEKIQSKNPIE